MYTHCPLIDLNSRTSFWEIKPNFIVEMKPQSYKTLILGHFRSLASANVNYLHLRGSNNSCLVNGNHLCKFWVQETTRSREIALIGSNWPISGPIFFGMVLGRVARIYLVDPKISSFYDLKCRNKSRSRASGEARREARGEY